MRAAWPTGRRSTAVALRIAATPETDDGERRVNERQPGRFQIDPIDGSSCAANSHRRVVQQIAVVKDRQENGELFPEQTDRVGGI